MYLLGETNTQRHRDGLTIMAQPWLATTGCTRRPRCGSSPVNADFRERIPISLMEPPYTRDGFIYQAFDVANRTLVCHRSLGND